MKFILGKKQEMTQKFKDDGTVVPVTVVSAGPCFITQVKTNEKEGYKAVQVGYLEAKKLNKVLSGHLQKIFPAKYLKEFRLDEQDEKEFKKGDQITVNVFAKGDIVKVAGNSKGRGFQGVVKRHGFHGAPKSHGTKDQLRHPGSIGATGPGHVFKGTKMGGRMGGGRVSVTNLEIVDVDPTKNLLFIKGAIPGARNGLVEITAPGEMDLTVKKAEEKKETKKIEEKPQKTDQPASRGEPQSEKEAAKIAIKEVKKDEKTETKEAQPENTEKKEIKKETKKEVKG